MKPNTFSKLSRGFTLMEISIALVVVALLVGGLMASRDLIRASEVRAQATQLERYDSAVTTFRIKHNCLPGDCAKAVTIKLGTAGGPGDNGDGDGDLGMMLAVTPEALNFWYHLSQAHLIDGTYPGCTTPPACQPAMPGVDTPSLKLKGHALAGNSGGGVWVTSLDSRCCVGAGLPAPNPFFNEKFKHAWYFGSQISPVDPNARTHIAADLYTLDSKIDDGLPLSGKMVAVDYVPILVGNFCYSVGGGVGGAVGCPSPAASLDACIDDTVQPEQYNLRYKRYTVTSMCSPLIRTTF